MQIIGFVEDECCFSTLTFMKTKLPNILTMHLELVVHMFSQKYFTLKTFPFSATIQNWKDNKLWYGVESWRLRPIYIQPPFWGFFLQPI
jgi:hypothetical protein